MNVKTEKEIISEEEKCTDIKDEDCKCSVEEKEEEAEENRYTRKGGYRDRRSRWKTNVCLSNVAHNSYGEQDPGGAALN